MQYFSTRGFGPVSCAQAILLGLAPDGGLFVPESFAHFTLDEIEQLGKLPYWKRAAVIMTPYLTDFNADEIEGMMRGAYAVEKFDDESIAPVKKIKDGLYALELYHGPTLAFKDMALQWLPWALPISGKKAGDGKKVLILTATSGDTGKAALEGFANAPDTAIAVYYPRDGVSAAQRLQMVTQEGDNTFVCAVEGNFDDAQRGVKEIFSSPDIAERLAQDGWRLSSANSINFGRLAPQIVYYFSAYADLVSRGDVALGDKINFCVPTGNFGNILAGYYAKCMGLPIGKLICASNRNHILADFLATGEYDARRDFYKTMSPSMDILVSSNLERLLYLLSGNDAQKTSGLMQALAQQGQYAVGEKVRELAAADFAGGWADENATSKTVAAYFEDGYLMDTHTAVGFAVLHAYQEKTKDVAPCVVVSTASPFKFSEDVLAAIGVDCTQMDEAQKAEKLAQVAKCLVPKPLAGITQKPILHTAICGKNDLGQALFGFVKAKEA